MTPTVIYGIHAVDAVLRRHCERIMRIWRDARRQDARLHALDARARDAGIAVSGCDARKLQAITGGDHHQGVAAEVRALPMQDEQGLAPLLRELDHPALLLLLDGIQDPHNLGACLRSADAAGVDAVVLPKDRACPVNATVHKVASGAAALIPIFRVTNLARGMQRLQEEGVWLVGAAEDAPRSVYDARLDGPLGLAVGGEGRGLRRLTRERCDDLVHIPMHGFVSSLNVSVAAGVCLFEVRRQRGGCG